MAYVTKKTNTSQDAKKPSISYWSKEKWLCPVCNKTFDREEMHTGGGRLIAGNMTDELHRLYQPSTKYGHIYPLIYAVGACPNCNTAFFWDDFQEIKDKKTLDNLYDNSEKRRQAVNTIFPYFELKRERTLLDGAAMYYLALLSYEKVDVKYSPTIKQGIISLRLAWICSDLHELCPGRQYDYVSQVFYRKAVFLYQQALEFESTRTEALSEVANLGPDTDNNFGFDGVVYLCGLLEYKYGQREDRQLRCKKLDEYKRAVARIVGLGHSSRAKPGPLLDKARQLHDLLSSETSDDSIFG